MKRFAMKQLQSWKEKGKRKPMIIMGADCRQSSFL